LLKRLEKLTQKGVVYQKLRAYLALLIDDAVLGDLLPIAVPKAVADEVLGELESRLAALQTEQTSLVAPTPAPPPETTRAAKAKPAAPTGRKKTPGIRPRAAAPDPPPEKPLLLVR
jgi:hypothetical protein